MKKYNLVVCGGTFDHFHKGHESFLRYVSSVGKKVIIGVTSDEYVRNSKFKIQNSKLIESYKIRKKNLEKFFIQKKVQDKVSILKIDDLFGPTLSRDLLIDAIVVSDDTKKGADSINKRRKELGLKELNILIAPSVYAKDGKLISSAKIRNGEINRAGKLYIKSAWLNTDLVLPEDLRKELQKPFGKLLKDMESLNVSKNSLVITVGDITAKIFNENFLKQDISIIDFKVARKEKFSSIAELGFSGDEKVIIANNPAGHITRDLFSKVLEIFKSNLNKRIILKTEGEEDLVVLPVILAAPLGTIIYYGQPPLRPAQRDFAGQAEAGIVRIGVSEETKEIAYGLVDGFETSHY